MTSTAAVAHPTAPILAPLYSEHPLFGSGIAFSQRPLSAIFEATARHGDVVRMRFPVAPYRAHLLRHPDHVQHILVDNVRNYGKQTRGYRKLRDVLGLGLVTSEGELWRRQRRIANPAFHRERIAHFAGTMVRCTNEMIDGWGSRLRTGEPFDVAREMTAVTLRIIGLTMLSTDLAAQANVVGHALDELLHTVLHRINHLVQLPPPIPTPRNRRFTRHLAALDGIVNGIIAERRALGGRGEADTAGDLISMLMSAKDPETGEGMSDQQLLDEAKTIFLAGHETTSNALTWTLYCLSRHPDVARRVRAEVVAALGDRPATLADLASLPYTERVLKESMRILPPVWMIARSVDGDDVIGGYTIEKGTWVFVSPYLTHRDARFWPNPEGFDPDRFLPEVEATRPKGAYFPFALGPRKCIGEAFSMMEAKLLLATLVQRTELSLVPGFVAQLDPTVTLRPRRGVWMTGRPVTAA